MTDATLARRAEELTAAVADLGTDVHTQAANQRRITRLIRWIVVGLAVLLVLALIVAWLLYRQVDANDRLTEASARIEEVQVRTSNQVLCPLFNVLIAFEPRSTTSPQISPEEQAQRREAYAVIHRAFDALRCQ